MNTKKVPSIETEIQIPVEVTYDNDEPADSFRTLSKYKKRKKKPEYYDDYRGDSSHHDRDKIVIQVKPTEPSYRPKCRDPAEEWSYSNDCDVQCDNQGTGHSDNYQDYGFYRSAKSGYRCRRMVSDVLLEEGYKNITTRADLGYAPETKDEYLRRTKKNLEGHHHHSNPEYVIVEKDPHYHRPPGECVCKRNYARLNGKCVPQSKCPRKSKTPVLF